MIIGQMLRTRLLLGVGAICLGVFPCAAFAQSEWATHAEIGLGGFFPVGALGTAGGFDARLRAGVDIHLAALVEPTSGPALRVGLNVVPATSTRVRPAADCVTDCTEKAYTTWIVAPGADVLWRARRIAPWYVVTGVGISMYAHPTGECVSLVGRFCPFTYKFTKNAVRPSLHLGSGFRGGTSSRLAIEGSDTLVPINGGQLQNDVRLGLSVRF